jgi:hypothetical protein
MIMIPHQFPAASWKDRSDHEDTEMDNLCEHARVRRVAQDVTQLKNLCHLFFSFCQAIKIRSLNCFAQGWRDDLGYVRPEMNSVLNWELLEHLEEGIQIQSLQNVRSSEFEL